MSSDGNTLIDGNGNAVEIHATSINPGFLANIWKRVRSSREAHPFKYEVRYQQRKQPCLGGPEEQQQDINLNNRCSTSGSIWSKLSAFTTTNHDKVDSGTTSICTSIENSPHESPAIFPPKPPPTILLGGESDPEEAEGIGRDTGGIFRKNGGEIGDQSGGEIGNPTGTRRGLGGDDQGGGGGGILRGKGGSGGDFRGRRSPRGEDRRGLEEDCLHEQRQRLLDNIYDDDANSNWSGIYFPLSRTKTNRKVYSNANNGNLNRNMNNRESNPEPPRVRTRMESIFGDIQSRRRYNNNSRPSSGNNNKNDAILIQQLGTVLFRQPSSGSSNNGNASNYYSDTKRVTFVPPASPSTASSSSGTASTSSSEPSEFENQCWNIRNRVIARENFYNVNEMDMAALYRSGKQSDVVVHCRGREFKVHSFVLKAQSGFFRRAMFMKSDSKPIVINDVTADDMEALLQYMYTGRVDDTYLDSTDDRERMISRFEFLLQDYDVPYPDER